MAGLVIAVNIQSTSVSQIHVKMPAFVMTLLASITVPAELDGMEPTVRSTLMSVPPPMRLVPLTSTPVLMVLATT